MYQLIQTLFQNFFSILCTNRSPSPVDLSFAETSADPHHDTDTPHQSTHAPPHTRRYVPTFPSALPYHCTVPRPPSRTTIPYHCTVPRPPSRTTIPYHCTVPRPPSRTTIPYHCTFPRPCRHTIANTTYHTPRRTIIPYNHAVPPDMPLQIQHTASPDTRFPYHAAAPLRPPQADPTPPPTRPARVAAGPTSTLTTAYRRRNAVTPPRHRPDASTPVAVPSGPQARL